MFETNDMAKINNPLSLHGDDANLWSHVTLRIHIPWFYIIYNMKYTDGTKRQDIILVTNINDLIGLINEKLIEIEQIYLVSPSHINKSNKWMMEPIEAIFVGLEPDHELYAHVYVVEKGSRYMDSGLGSKENELRDIQPLYMNSNES
ncbi:MAG: hypothetical protein QM484_14440 [Woeseiaceae bacterium]